MDVAKHFSTLSAGSIVLIATLIDKLPKPLSDTTSLRDAIVCLLVSLGLSIFYLWTPWETLDPNPRQIVVSVNRFAFLFAGLFFLIGLVALGTFAITNIQYLGHIPK